ncbi:MAG: TrkH family potassium uptake protein [Thermosphaera sp.]
MVLLRGFNILKTVAALFSLLGGLMMFVPLVDFLSGASISRVFLAFSIVLLAGGTLLVYKVKSEEGLSFIEATISSTLAWTLLPAVSAIPLSIELGIPYFDAFFESVSGFTGTGLTVLTGLDSMKPSILFWRALMQWVGELGFVVFAMVLFPFFYKYGLLMYGVERPIRIEASMYRTARRLFNIYIILTLAGTLMLYYTGMNVFDALVHSMTGIATGGMSNYDSNYDQIYRTAPLTSIPLIIIMVLGATNFLLLDKLLRGEGGQVVGNEEFKLYVSLLAFFSIITSLTVVVSNPSSIQEGIVSGVFNAISAMTTTGFNIGSINQLPYVSKLILAFSMFIGGMTFATVGGIKVMRFLILLKKLKASSVNIVTGGRAEVRVRLGGNILEDSEVASAMLITVIHFTTIFVGATLIKSMVPAFDYADAFFESASASSCVGLSVGITSPLAPAGVKAVLIVLMILGRLEYLPLLMLIGYVAGRKTIKLLK